VRVRVQGPLQLLADLVEERVGGEGGPGGVGVTESGGGRGSNVVSAVASAAAAAAATKAGRERVTEEEGSGFYSLRFFMLLLTLQ